MMQRILFQITKQWLELFCATVFFSIFIILIHVCMFNAILYLFLSGGIEDVYEQSAFEYVLVVVWLLAYCSCIALERLILFPV